MKEALTSRRRTCILLVCINLISFGEAVAQTAGGRLVYDVVSVKPALPGATGGIVPLPGGVGYNVTATLKVMLSVMYRIPLRQISGGPEWAESEKFEVKVKADKQHSIDDLHVMFQNALADRFGLKLHLETRTGPVFLLTIAKSGLKMAAVDAGNDRNIPISDGPNNEAIGSRVPMNYLCYWLGQRLQNDQRPVVDGTGLTGYYDFRLSFRPEFRPWEDPGPNDPNDLPTIFEAVKSQLGLELTPQAGPVQTLVIDRVDVPTAN